MVIIRHLIVFPRNSADATVTYTNICHFSVVCYCAELVPLILRRRRNRGGEQRNCVRSPIAVLPAISSRNDHRECVFWLFRSVSMEKGKKSLAGTFKFTLPRVCCRGEFSEINHSHWRSRQSQVIFKQTYQLLLRLRPPIRFRSAMKSFILSQ